MGDRLRWRCNFLLGPGLAPELGRSQLGRPGPGCGGGWRQRLQACRKMLCCTQCDPCCCARQPSHSFFPRPAFAPEPACRAGPACPTTSAPPWRFSSASLTLPWAPASASAGRPSPWPTPGEAPSLLGCLPASPPACLPKNMLVRPRSHAQSASCNHIPQACPAPPARLLLL